MVLDFVRFTYSYNQAKLNYLNINQTVNAIIFKIDI